MSSSTLISGVIARESRPSLEDVCEDVRRAAKDEVTNEAAHMRLRRIRAGRTGKAETPVEPLVVEHEQQRPVDQAPGRADARDPFASEDVQRAGHCAERVVDQLLAE